MRSGDSDATKTVNKKGGIIMEENEKDSLLEKARERLMEAGDEGSRRVCGPAIAMRRKP